MFLGPKPCKYSVLCLCRSGGVWPRRSGLWGFLLSPSGPVVTSASWLGPSSTAFHCLHRGSLLWGVCVFGGCFIRSLQLLSVTAERRPPSLCCYGYLKQNCCSATDESEQVAVLSLFLSLELMLDSLAAHTPACWLTVILLNAACCMLVGVYTKHTELFITSVSSPYYFSLSLSCFHYVTKLNICFSDAHNGQRSRNVVILEM